MPAAVARTGLAAELPRILDGEQGAPSSCGAAPSSSAGAGAQGSSGPVCPVITVLDDLDEDALVRVLKEPRNSLVKQYKELLGMDNVELEFTDEALHAIARKTIERKTGARGLRAA